MVPVYAAHTAQKPAMWGGVVPDQRYVAELAGVLAGEWSRAVDQLLKNFAVPPTLGGGW